MDNLVVEEYTQNGLSMQAISKKYNMSWNKVKQILVKNNVQIISKRNQYNVDIKMKEDIFEKIDSSEKAYWLGLLYADGYIRKDRNEIGLTLQEKDKETVQSFHDFCGISNNIRRHIITRKGKEYTSYDCTFSSKKVKNDLINLGCVAQKSLVLTFPTKEQVPDAFLYDFIRGYVDGDGYVQFDKNKSRYRIIILGTKAFLEGLVQRTGWDENYHIRKQQNQKVYTLEFSKKQLVQDKLKFLYENSIQHLDRKYQIYLTSLGK